MAMIKIFRRSDGRYLKQGRFIGRVRWTDSFEDGRDFRAFSHAQQRIASLPKNDVYVIDERNEWFAMQFHDGRWVTGAANGMAVLGRKSQRIEHTQKGTLKIWMHHHLHRDWASVVQIVEVTDDKLRG